jgi:hypothetical protein
MAPGRRHSIVAKPSERQLIQINRGTDCRRFLARLGIGRVARFWRAVTGRPWDIWKAKAFGAGEN